VLVCWGNWVEVVSFSCEIVYRWVIGINPVLVDAPLAFYLSIHLNFASLYRLNIMVPASPRFPKWFIPLWFPGCLLSPAFYMFCPIIIIIIIIIINLSTDRYSHTRWFEVNTKEIEKLSKCKGLEIEVSRMWKVRTKIVPVVIGALGTIKGLDHNFQLLSGHPSATELPKIALMSTAHTISRMLG
jgi:hypothetical protein